MNLDYENFLKKSGITDTFIKSIPDNDVIPIENCLFELRKSGIEGTGLFSRHDFMSKQYLCKARIGRNRTWAGRYINHSDSPNVYFKANGNDIDVYSMKSIGNNEELMVDYTQAMQVNDAFIFNFPMLAEATHIDLSQYNNRQKIEIIEWVILNAMVNIADELPIKHDVYAGMYAREIFIPSGVVLTGKIHLEDHICILSQGDLSVMTDDGIKRIQAPYTFNAKRGIKKIGYAHSDCTFTTVHKTDLIDIEEIENTLFSDGDISWVNEIMNKNLLEAA